MKLQRGHMFCYIVSLSIKLLAASDIVGIHKCFIYCLNTSQIEGSEF